MYTSQISPRPRRGRVAQRNFCLPRDGIAASVASQFQIRAGQTARQMARVRIAVVTTIRYSLRSDLQIITPKDRAQGLSRWYFRPPWRHSHLESLGDVCLPFAMRIYLVDFSHILDMTRDDSFLLAGEL